MVVQTKPDVDAVIGAGIRNVNGGVSWDPAVGGAAGAEATVLKCDYSSFSVGLLFTLLGAAYVENVGIDPISMYQTKSAMAENEFSGKVNLSYLQIPLLYRYQANSGFYGEVGIQPGLLMSAKDKVDGASSYDYKDYIKTFDLGIPLGAGYQINDRLSVGARAVFGVTNINTDGTEMYSSDDTDRNFALFAVARYTLTKK